MKKQLLQESEIRKMMKFANLGALSNNFVEKLNEWTYGDDDTVEEDLMFEDDEEDVPGDVPPGGPPAGMEAGPEELPDAEPVGEPDLGAEEPGGPAEAEVDPEVVKTAVMTIIDGLKEKLQELYGEAAPDLQATEEEGPDEELPGEELPGEELPGGEPEGLDAPEGPEMGMGPPEEEEGLEEDFINEMTRKVAARLVRAAKR